MILRNYYKKIYIYARFVGIIETRIYNQDSTEVLEFSFNTLNTLV